MVQRHAASTAVLQAMPQRIKASTHNQLVIPPQTGRMLLCFSQDNNRKTSLSPGLRVGKMALEGFVHSEDGFLRPAEVQAAGVVQRYVTHLQQPRPLGQVAHLMHVAGDAADLHLFAVSGSRRVKHPIWREMKKWKSNGGNFPKRSLQCFQTWIKEIWELAKPNS